MDTTNTTEKCRNRLASYFIAEILRDNTNRVKKYRQADIIRKLDEYPYELALHRRAISDYVELLVNEGIGYHCDGNGVWYEKPVKCF